MKVVSNTSPLSYLVLIQQVDLLPALFGHALIPQAVQIELMHVRAPAAVREWAKHPPQWLEIRVVSPASDPRLIRLHPGEQEAIALAQEVSADLVMLDDKAARQAALDRELRVVGLLGVLAAGAERGLLDLPDSLERLMQTNFRVAPDVLKALLDRYAGGQP